ncbi:vgrg protein [Clostridium sporogenes]|uniref:Vgrg protein n=1 Tax=Clostridium botulinum TaxID=1491 RepID=A0A6M0SWD9_CLOBO|nr:vgrg protein [Clostridium sporogenes]NFA58970.1 vgrg protein [Clostridium botulinum]NFI73553.1 vgrg protein [Clostridium sporogenes]NFL71604.1 vgrg protein [Clostridium sporogenes]NFM25805.1 vgrg protein [Clostridium sporogenes]NFP61199.1 vgrg protein [Clostridium sporogenes]
MMSYTNLVSNMFLNQYKAQMNNSNNANKIDDKTVESLDQQKAMQQMVFEAVLSQMMNSMGSTNGMNSVNGIDSMSNMSTMNGMYGMSSMSNIGSMNGMGSLIATQALLSGLKNAALFGFNDSLSALGNFNSTIRGASKFLSKDYNSGGTDSNISALGIRASKYESDLNPAEISDDPGDYGGKSYGAWQFSSKTGSLDSFINSLKGNNNDMYYKLVNAKANDNNTFGENFDAAWKSIASQNKDRFLKVQQNYVKVNFYDTVAQSLKSKLNFDISKRSNALKESLWSTVVQHGVGGATSIFSKLNLNNSDSNIINDLYNERQNVNLYFRSSSPEIRQSVYNRFTREKQDMLSMLNEQFV